MERVTQRLGAARPVGWVDVIVRAAKTAAVAFVVLQAKELFDAGALDTPATAADAGLIAGGVFLLYAIHNVAKS